MEAEVTSPMGPVFIKALQKRAAPRSALKLSWQWQPHYLEFKTTETPVVVSKDRADSGPQDSYCVQGDYKLLCGSYTGLFNHWTFSGHGSAELTKLWHHLPEAQRNPADTAAIWCPCFHGTKQFGKYAQNPRDKLYRGFHVVLKQHRLTNGLVQSRSTSWRN